MMDSSFLYWFHVLLTIFLFLGFLKLVIKFGISNHPSFHLFLMIFLSAISFSCLEVLNFSSALRIEELTRWQNAFAQVLLATLQVQLLSVSTEMHQAQWRALSRLPMIWGLIVFGFFNPQANFLFSAQIVLLCLNFLFMTQDLRLVKRLLAIFIGLLICLGFLSELEWTYQLLILVISLIFYRLEKLFLLSHYLYKQQELRA